MTYLMGKVDHRLSDGLAFRMTPEQREFLEEAADACGVSMCEVVRRLISHEMSRSAGIQAERGVGAHRRTGRDSGV